MEDKNPQHIHDNKSPDRCNCMACQMGGHRHIALRLILGLIILGMVFCLGMKIGEFKGEFMRQDRHGYGHERMMMYYGGNMKAGTMGDKAAPTVPAPSTMTPQPAR